MLGLLHRIHSLSAACIVGVVAVLAGACGDPPPKREWTAADHGQPSGAAPDRAPAADAPPDGGAQDPLARAAAALWNASCASCHGRDGRGQGAGRPPGAQIADFSAQSFQTARSDEQLSAVIRDGRGMMPAFGKQVNEHGVAALVQHIRRLAPQGDPAVAPAPAAPDAGPQAPPR